MNTKNDNEIRNKKLREEKWLEIGRVSGEIDWLVATNILVCENLWFT